MLIGFVSILTEADDERARVVRGSHVWYPNLYRTNYPSWARGEQPVGQVSLVGYDLFPTARSEFVRENPEHPVGNYNPCFCHFDGKAASQPDANERMGQGGEGEAFYSTRKDSRT